MQAYRVSMKYTEFIGALRLPIMGRRKKQFSFPYEEIVSSSYIRAQDYARAQAMYSEGLDKPRNAPLAPPPDPYDDGPGEDDE